MESEITSSSSFSVMPRTPVEVRLWNSRTSVAAKRMALPCRVASSTSSPSVSNATPIRRSVAPSSKRIAILPLVGTLVKESMLFRRTPPRAVTNTTWRFFHSSSSSGNGSTVWMISPLASGSRLTIGRPREPGPLSLTHKRFKSGQFCMGTIEDVFLMAPITAEARGGISESPVKLEASSRACDYREQDCRALADAVMALRQIPGYRDRAPASKCNAYECTVPVYQCPKLGLAKQGNLESLAGRRMDEPLAGKSIEAVAHGRHADAQFRSEPGGFKALPRWPDASEKAPPERIVGWLENIGGTHMFSPRPIDRSLLSSLPDRA